MILSYSKKFLFIKGKKVGGTSVEILLSSLCGPDDIITPILPIDERARVSAGGRAAQNYGAEAGEAEAYLNAVRHASAADLGSLKLPAGRYYNHMSYREVLDQHGPIPSDFLVFCVDRCPYRKVLSWANMVGSLKAYKRGGEMRSSAEGLAAALDKGVATGAISTVRNIERYLDAEGRVVPRVLRYEELSKQLGEFLCELGIASAPPLPHVKKGLLSDTLHLNDFLRPEHIIAINQAFAEEFEAFGYPVVEPR